MTTPTWWQDAIGYQIYPRSFADANGDGIGDLQGVIDQLDYLQDLGITCLWFSPFFPSPLLDVGYDISDYNDIAPEYGTLADFDRLLKAAHARGIRVLLDLVLNHTSDQHEWFKKSRSSRANPKRDWYVWENPRFDDRGNRLPPNDWESIFGGSAWDWDETTGQYYYHFFLKEQPDLNWRNPAVKQAMYEMVHFWLKRGVDGFRLDAINTLFEVPELPDAGMSRSILEIWLEHWREGVGWTDELAQKIRFQHQQSELHDVVRDLRKITDQYPGTIMLGESQEVSFYGNGRDQLHSVFNFELTNHFHLGAEAIRKVLKRRLPTVPREAWECNTIGNHDRSRAWTIAADGKHDRLRYQTGLAITMLLRGTPMFYYGEEIGMTDFFDGTAEAIKDGLGMWAYHAMLEHTGNTSEALAAAQKISRDRCRTPMQWRDAPNAGFSPEGIEPWLPVNPNYAQGVNVTDQLQDPGSVLHFFRTLAQLRQSYVALRRGDFRLASSMGEVLGFWRSSKDQTCLVAINLSAEEVTAALGVMRVKPVYSSYELKMYSPLEAARLQPSKALSALPLRPYEIFVGVV